MPNSPKTPTRTIRVSNDLWNAVKDKAKIDGRTVTDVIIEALKEYVKDQELHPVSAWVYALAKLTQEGKDGKSSHTTTQAEL